MDERLRDQGLDLLAKHWVIYAEKGLPEETITVPKKLPGSSEGKGVQGAYDADYLDYDGPVEAEVGREFRAKVTLLSEIAASASGRASGGMPRITSAITGWTGGATPESPG